MTFRTISQPQYAIDLPGFEHLVFTESTSEYLSLPQSVMVAMERTSVLQSAREAWAFRISAQGSLESNLYQSTRTAALGVKIDGDYYLAIDDNNDPAANILLARAQEGYDSHRTTGKWLVPRSDPLIKAMLSRAEQGQRIVTAPNDTMELSTIPGRDGASAWGTHPLTQAILGKDLTERVATYLSNKNFTNGYVWALSPAKLAKLGVDDNRVDVRRVVVGGDDIFNYSGSLYADDLCDDGGLARGVRNISTRNKS